jgi:AcrR family transcriptional regulator
MPRIDAPTVAEHRARQAAGLTDAAERLLRDGGWSALTFAALGEATGLARSSVYEYFRTRDEVALAVCERAFPRWRERTEAAVAAAGEESLAQVAAYVGAQLDLVDAGEHRIAQELARAPLAAEVRARIGALHAGWLDLLDAPLAALGVERPRRVAGLVQGVVEAATRQLQAAPGERDEVVAAAVGFATAAVAAAPATLAR